MKHLSLVATFLLAFLLALPVYGQTFPDDWTRRTELTTNPASVPSTQSDFPVLLTEDSLPSEMFDADGANPAQNGGGDIRFSSDEAGTTQLAVEIVRFVTDNDPANGEAEIWVKVPSVSASAGTDIYVWYNTAGAESQPAVTDTFGRNAVWSNSFDAVFHFEEESGDYVNSVGDGNNITSVPTGFTRGAAGAFGSGGKAVDAAGTQTLPLEPASPDPGYYHDAFSVVAYSAWASRDQDTTGPNVLYEEGGGASGISIFYRSSPNTMHFISTESVEIDSTSTFAEGSNPFFLAARLDGSDAYLLINGTQEATTTQTGTFSAATSGPGIGHTEGTEVGSADKAWDGIIDEFRRHSDDKSNDWFTTEHNNQSDLATFWTVGTPEDAGGADTDPPTFTVAPAAEAITDDSVNITATLDEDGTIYAVVIADGATAPSSAQVKAGQDSTGSAALDADSTSATASVEATISLLGNNILSAETAYDAYVVAEDDEGTPNIQASPTKVDFTTTAAGAGNIIPIIMHHRNQLNQ